MQDERSPSRVVAFGPDDVAHVEAQRILLRGSRTLDGQIDGKQHLGFVPGGAHVLRDELRLPEIESRCLLPLVDRALQLPFSNRRIGTGLRRAPLPPLDGIGQHEALVPLRHRRAARAEVQPHLAEALEARIERGAGHRPRGAQHARPRPVLKQVHPAAVVDVVVVLMELEIEEHVLHQLQHLDADVEALPALAFARGQPVVHLGSTRPLRPLRSCCRQPHECWHLGKHLRVQKPERVAAAHDVPDFFERGRVFAQGIRWRRRRPAPALANQREQFDRRQRPALFGPRGAGEGVLDGVKAQRPIALELRLVEELVARGLVWKRGMLRRVAEHVGRLVAGERALDVEERSGNFRGIAFLHRRQPVVANRPHRAVPHRAAIGAGTQVAQIDVDVDAEVRAAPLDGIAKILERDIAVVSGVARDDQPAATAHQLVDAEVLEVATVREVHPFPVVGRHPEQLVEQLAQRQAGLLVGPHLVEPRVPQPPPQTNVEHGHQEGQRR